MGLETGTYIDDLVATNPVHTDGLNQTDAHLRLIKTVLLNTFPNMEGVVTASYSDLNGITGFMTKGSGVAEVPIPTSSTTTGGSLVLTGAGTNPNITLQNLNGVLTILSGTTVIATLDTSGNLTATAAVNGASIKQAGNPLLPSGMIMKWSGAANAIPAGFVLCNGSNSTPDLQDCFIIGAGDVYSVAQTGGAVSASVTTSTAGSHNHTGTVDTQGAHVHNISVASAGSHNHGGTDEGYALQVGDIPSHDHIFNVATVGSVGAGGQCVMESSGVSGTTFPTQNTGSGNTHYHGIATDGVHTHSATMDTQGAHLHNISTDGSHNHTASVATLPPYYALCFVMKT